MRTCVHARMPVQLAPSTGRRTAVAAALACVCGPRCTLANTSRCFAAAPHHPEPPRPTVAVLPSSPSCHPNDTQQAAQLIRSMMGMLTGAPAAPVPAAAVGGGPAALTPVAAATSLAPPLLLSLHELLQRLLQGDAGAGAAAAQAAAAVIPSALADPSQWREHQQALTAALQRVLRGRDGVDALSAQPTGRVEPGQAGPPGAGLGAVGLSGACPGVRASLAHKARCRVALVVSRSGRGMRKKFTPQQLTSLKKPCC
jgi:hypothetical protein